MQPACAPLVAEVAAVARHRASLEIVSTSLARAVAQDELSDPDYWGRQLMSPVRFADAIVAAAMDEHAILLEVGPGQTLSTLAKQTLAAQQGNRTILSCLGPVQAPGSDVQNVLAAIGRLWVGGVNPDWNALQAGRRRRVALPTYPFERKSFWAVPRALAFGSDRGDADAHPAAATTGDTRAAPQSAAAATDTTSADAERLIQQQLALIAEQIRIMAQSNE
jgi:acyl transferase domain-containing protein